MTTDRVDIYLPLYVRDFITSTLGWSAEEKGHYLCLLMMQWDRGGLPDDLNRLERLSPGVSFVWEFLEEKFPVCDDGKRRNSRLEKHRTKAIELKERRSAAAKKAADARTRGQHPQSKRRANVDESLSKRSADVDESLTNREAKNNHPPPPPPPPPNSYPDQDKFTHTQPPAEIAEEFEAGWATDEWERFAAVWNATERASPWKPLMAPSSWVDHAASPGWLQRAMQAMEHLPSCQWFESPLAVTRFFEYVDRILAGEFDNPKPKLSRGLAPTRENCL